MDKIFVQIASYRDPELNPTIENCLSKAKYPERLTFGICHQHSDKDKWDNLDKYKDNPNFTVMDVPWNESKGLCWARHHIQKMWKGEKYTLQLDSHHRFLENWDEELIEMMKLTNSSKPIITSYAGMYDPDENKLLNHDPYKMVGKKFTDEGTILFYPETIEGWEKLTKPIKARFVSGHFFFTLGIHCKEYKYDPELYFAGDEISLSIRSYTLGYDLFHPHKVVIWHEYTRKHRVKHWDDFKEKNQSITNNLWHDLDKVSKKRLRHMLQEEDNGSIIGEYGLGDKRSHSDYEKYAGIDFAKRRLHPDTIGGYEPPTTIGIENIEWKESPEQEYNLHLDWSNEWSKIRKQISCTCKFDFIYLGIENEKEELLHRVDLTNQKHLMGKSKSIDVKFKSISKPYKYILWPHQIKGDWLQRIDIKL
jgi:hypothetical protein